MTQHLSKNKINDKVAAYSEVHPNRPNIFISSQCIYLNPLSTSYDSHLLNM
jgi:hypothetical protein